LEAQTNWHSHEPQTQHAFDHAAGDLAFLMQRANGIAFDEEIEEIEESLPAQNPDQMFSEENFFLSLIFGVILILLVVLYCTRKRTLEGSFETQAGKYKSLGASVGSSAGRV